MTGLFSPENFSKVKGIIITVLLVVIPNLDVLICHKNDCQNSSTLFYIILFSRFLGFGLISTLIISLYTYFKNDYNRQHGIPI